MLAFDCVLETHEAVQFTAENHQELAAKIRQHRDQYHPEISDDEIREMIAAGAYDPEARAAAAPDSRDVGEIGFLDAGGARTQ